MFTFILFVSDKPSVSIERHTSSALEAGRGSLTLTCNSQSNPPGRVMWYREGEAASPQYRCVLYVLYRCTVCNRFVLYRDQLVFDPITKAQAGDYVCVAENSVGRSREAVTNVEVLCEYQDSQQCFFLALFSPSSHGSLLSDGPDNLVTSPVSAATVGLHNRYTRFSNAMSYHEIISEPA